MERHLILVCMLVNLIAGHTVEDMRGLSDSVKEMRENGLAHEEIVQNVKVEVKIRGLTGLLWKLTEKLMAEETSMLRESEEPDDATIESLLQQLKSQEINQERDFFPLNSKWSKKPKPQYAFSPFDLAELVHTEEYVYDRIKTHMQHLEKTLKLMKTYVKDYDESSGVIASSEPDDRARAVVSNPIASYRMIRRFAVTLPMIWSSRDAVDERLLDEETMITRPPDQRDLDDSVDAILRIMYFNGYSVHNFANGQIGGVNSPVSVTPQQCFEIGVHALRLKQFVQAIEWLRAAQDRRIAGDPEPEVLQRAIEQGINQHNKMHDDVEGTEFSHLEYYVYDRKIESVHQMQTPNISKFRSEAKRLTHNLEWGDHIISNFVTLCSGDNFQSEQAKSALYCWVENKVHAYLTINPLKMELLSSDPYVVQIYDVVGPELMRAVKNYSVGRFERSVMLDYDDAGNSVVNNDRTSLSAWIHDRFSDTPTHKRVLSTLKLIEKISGLSVVKIGSSEAPQVALYGTSHHYGSHLDAIQMPSLTESDEFGGDRIATFMLYLSSVEGGKTAFPLLGMAAEPIQGSGVFWYNFKRSGELDKRTHHGGCPVAHGIKWVMNSWIHAHDNFLNRPCGLQHDQ